MIDGAVPSRAARPSRTIRSPMSFSIFCFFDSRSVTRARFGIANGDAGPSMASPFGLFFFFVSENSGTICRSRHHCAKWSMASVNGWSSQCRITTRPALPDSAMV